MLVDCIRTYTSRNLKLCNLFIDGYEINYINPICLIFDSLRVCSCFQQWCLFVIGLLLRLYVIPKALQLLSVACIKDFVYIVECEIGSKLNSEIISSKNLGKWKYRCMHF